jgi:hypothetical protein
MSVYLVTNNYSFSIAKVQLFLKMMFFFGFLAIQYLLFHFISIVKHFPFTMNTVK